jgi:hypothetical protein
MSGATKPRAGQPTVDGARSIIQKAAKRFNPKRLLANTSVGKPSLICRIQEYRRRPRKSVPACAKLVGMSEDTRILQFLEKIEQGKPIKGVCSVCRRLFVAESKPGERLEVALLRMRPEFDAHDCHEETRQMTARIVRATKERL